jgi:acetyl-CoA decarbonylase/synthase complex subunit gamma
MEFVTDLLERRVKLDDCPEEHLPVKKRKQIADLVSPPQMPLEFGVGERMATIGGEEAFHRHDLTFFNQTAIAVEVYDEMLDLIDVVKYLNDFAVFRIGENLTLDAIAIRSTSNNPDMYAKTVKLIADAVKIPLILCSFNPEVLSAAVAKIKNKKPLLYAATKENWKEIGKLACENNLPVVCFSTNLDELISIAESIESMGVKEIALDPGTMMGEGYSTTTLNKLMQIRYSSIRDGSTLTKYPTVGVPASIWAIEKPKSDDDVFSVQYKEALTAILMLSEDVSMIIIHSGRTQEDVWIPLALMTYRQNIFTDPRIYPRVDAGFFKVGNPDKNSPIFMTSNYRMTKIPVEQDIKDAHIDSWLLVVDTEGLGIEAGVAGGQLSSDKIAEAIKEFNVFDAVDHRVVVIPGMAARLSGAIEDDANCYVVVGPNDSSGLQKFMESEWDLDKFMKEFNDR